MVTLQEDAQKYIEDRRRPSTTLNTSVIYFVTLEVEAYVKNTVVANQRESVKYKTTTIAVTTKPLSMGDDDTVLLTVDGVGGLEAAAVYRVSST